MTFEYPKKTGTLTPEQEARFDEMFPRREPCCNSAHVPPDTACRTFVVGINGRCVYCDHAAKCHPGPGATCEIGSGESGNP